MQRALAAVLLVSAICAVQASASALPEDLTSYGAASLAIERSDASAKERGRQLAALYDARLAPLEARAGGPDVSKDELKLLVQAADVVSFYTHDPERARRFTRLAQLLRDRHDAASSEMERAASALYSARLVTEARAVATTAGLGADADYPEIRDLVGMDTGIRTQIRVDASGKPTRVPSPAFQSAQIVAVGHPNCHFSSNAARDISADPIISKALKGKMLWIAPQSRNADFKTIADWNRDHPFAEFSIAYRESEWPELDSWNTPTFYFFKDGALVGTVVGWPKEGNVEAMRRAIQLIGIPLDQEK